MNRTRHLIALGAASATAALLATVGLAAPALAATPDGSTPASGTAACDRTAWEAPVQGAPHGLTAGARGGDYLWHDTHGFHLRVTHPGTARVVYTGVITSPTAMRIDPVKLEKGDVVTLSPSHRTLTYSLVDYGRIDGVNFHTDCAATLTVSRLHEGDRSLPIVRVFLGEHRTHPKHIPFTVHRVAA